jgi:hypothetical protein
MCSADNDDPRDIARKIEEEIPGWLVVWGAYTRQFVAFPPVGSPRGTIFTASYPCALIERIRKAEHNFRSSPQKGG